VQRRFHRIIRNTRIRPARALEVGGVMDENSLLRAPELEGVPRFCLNLVAMDSADGIESLVGNANDMSCFEDAMFDLVLCNATLEHDPFFWLSIAEMKRVLAPGGLLVIGTPGFVRDREHDWGKMTATYRVHYKFDYYRFSEQAYRDVFFADMEDVKVAAILRPPRLIGHGWKPGVRPRDPLPRPPLTKRVRRRATQWAKGS
jgi:SAM-dependent methyltransferase